jgi:hypothetical protein
MIIYDKNGEMTRLKTRLSAFFVKHPQDRAMSISENGMDPFLRVSRSKFANGLKRPFCNFAETARGPFDDSVYL